MRGKEGLILVTKGFRCFNFYSIDYSIVLTPDFGMCQGRVLQTRKVSASYDRWVWRGDRVPRSNILLTQEEDLQTQIYSTCNLLSRR